MMNLHTHRVTLCDDEYEAKMDAHFAAQKRAPYVPPTAEGTISRSAWEVAPHCESHCLRGLPCICTPDAGSQAACVLGMGDAEEQVSDAAVQRWKWAAIVVTLAWVALVGVCLRELVRALP